ncbi:hypothetical protein BUALT_Bualt19G0079400 [Buddleja alternifolia]|uniref:Uncharacterized protein n=1 Tax=Buddleja alternifolia TaxID=168488 RepID=A0AAV6W0C8_9LAMI|nr:hypothetical protein BUALT_Bualt19G0078300 [Buddleja alternifolia]KAG8363986.1 hypothetical protein BUALT_Bualt19G0079400 [Buddleja alternifolia]
MSDKERPIVDHGGGGGDDEDDGDRPTKKGDPNEKKCKGCKKKGKRVSIFRLRKEKRKQRGILRRTVEDSSGESPTTSDPNNSEFSFDMLRGLIEKNDFYSKECNPHLDVDENTIEKSECDQRI